MKLHLTRLSRVLLVAALFATTAFAANDKEGAIYDAETAFEALKSFEGEWNSTPIEGDSTRKSTVVYKVSAAGHSVIKTFNPGSEYEMFSVYHMDGDELLMTHYCAIGNQPKMKFEATGKPGEIYFGFDGGTNFDPKTDAHAHEGSTLVTGPNTQESMAIGHSDGKAKPARRSALTRSE